MRKIRIILLCISFVLSISGCSASNAGQVFYGDWVVDSKLPDAPAGDFNEEDLNKILGSELSFTADEASCFGDSVDTLGKTVTSPQYTKTEMSRSDFESMTAETFDVIGRSGNKITQVSVINDPESNTGIVFYIVDENTLLANSAGTFLLVKRK